MITTSNTTAVGAMFPNAPNDSAFGKVFLNNMDGNSFNSNSKKQIALMILKGKTAFFNEHREVVSQQDSNCQVNNSKVFYLRIS